MIGSGTKPETKEVQKVENKSETVRDNPSQSETVTNGNRLKMLKKERSREDGRQAFVNYAYQIGGEDLVYLMECENATRNMYRQSEVKRNGKQEESYGFCQIHKPDHPEIINNPLFWSDAKRQIEQCNSLMKGGTKFYGPSRIVKGQKCSTYVKSRFYFE